MLGTWRPPGLPGSRSASAGRRGESQSRLGQAHARAAPEGHLRDSRAASCRPTSPSAARGFNEMPKSKRDKKGGRRGHRDLGGALAGEDTERDAGASAGGGLGRRSHGRELEPGRVQGSETLHGLEGSRSSPGRKGRSQTPGLCPMSILAHVFPLSPFPCPFVLWAPATPVSFPFFQHRLFATSGALQSLLGILVLLLSWGWSLLGCQFTGTF